MIHLHVFIDAVCEVRFLRRGSFVAIDERFGRSAHLRFKHDLWRFPHSIRTGCTDFNSSSLSFIRITPFVLSRDAPVIDASIAVFRR